MKIYEIPDSNLKITLDERAEENAQEEEIEEYEPGLNPTHESDET